MRISDWSSDVCSSDLSPVRFYGQYLVEVPALPDSEQQRRHYDEVLSRLARERQYGIVRRLYPRLPGADRSAMASVSLPAPKQVAYWPVHWARTLEARKSVGEGKRVAGRVELGGRGSLKKKKN